MKTLVAALLTLMLAGCTSAVPGPTPGTLTITEEVLNAETDRRATEYTERISHMVDCKLLASEYDKQDTGDSPYRIVFMEAIEKQMAENKCPEDSR